VFLRPERDREDQDDYVSHALHLIPSMLILYLAGAG